MEEGRYVIIDGKEIPKWASKAPEERNDWDKFKARLWHEVCVMSKDLYANPENWRERIEHPDHTWPWYNVPNVYFDKYISEDYISLHTPIPNIDLDDEKKSPLPGFTLRQIIDSLYKCAFNKIGKDKPKKH